MKNRVNHIAIIMDGNGRWAKNKGLKRSKGHEKGAEVVRDITKYCAAHQDINFLTLYAFSTENWKRPKIEVDFLIKLLQIYLKKELALYLKNDIKFKAIGDLTKFPRSLQDLIIKTEKETQNCKSLKHILALNYGSHDEINRALKALNAKNLDINIKNIQANLDIQEDVDLFIRTGGDHRLSNFLLWQSSYAELFFSDTLWPDFTTQELENIIEKFTTIERRFGGLK